MKNTVDILLDIKCLELGILPPREWEPEGKSHNAFQQITPAEAHAMKRKYRKLLRKGLKKTKGKKAKKALARYTVGKPGHKLNSLTRSYTVYNFIKSEYIKPMLERKVTQAAKGDGL